ncbi:toll/interleukin-1 receptor domain-containing protein [Pannus brasiliensis CCIBt3594]|uniref:Toll/interleukin-1 receptor domain-containing protein n=1 Tax=Pannus brasiliensis CCIBt3594 TaxID=1427578 RepID=A0AAW9QEJ7_9CHRO
MSDTYDAFISHASEDKEAVAKPLAEILMAFGLNVWLDIFTLEVGDSLLESIDEGLANSKFGVVVLSRSFFSKGWTKYELRSLLTREIGKSKVVLPLWHDISRQEIERVSPPLADKVALDTSKKSLSEIALNLLKVIRPDIFNNLTRYIAWLNSKSDGRWEYIDLSKLVPSPIRHSSLPEDLLIRAKIVYQALEKVMHSSLELFIENFQREFYPYNELKVWEKIAATYLDVTFQQDFSSNKLQSIYANLISISMQPNEKIQEMLNSDDEFIKTLIIAYANVALPISDSDV